MGEKGSKQGELFVPHESVRHAAGHPFCQALEKILREANFDRRVEAMCRKFYASLHHAQQATSEYVDFYDYERIHSSIAYVSPAAAELNPVPAPLAA